jgi:hypothetical protein
MVLPLLLLGHVKAWYRPHIGLLEKLFNPKAITMEGVISSILDVL